MSNKVYNVSVFFDLHKVTCPGVWLCPKGKTFLKICLFGVSDLTKEVDPFFPLVFKERFHFRRTFKNTNSVFELHDQLGRSIISLELLQIPSASSGCVRLGVFNALLSDVLHPYPTCFAKPINTSGLELLFSPCKVFPGIIAPKASVLVSVNIADTAGDKKTPASVKQGINGEDRRRQHSVCHTKDNARCKCFKIPSDDKRLSTEMDRNDVKIIRSRPILGLESAVKPSSSDERSLDEYPASSIPTSTAAEDRTHATAAGPRRMTQNVPNRFQQGEDPIESNVEPGPMRGSRDSPPQIAQHNQIIDPPDNRKWEVLESNQYSYNTIRQALNECERQLRLCKKNILENGESVRGEQPAAAEANYREQVHPAARETRRMSDKPRQKASDGLYSEKEGEDNRNGVTKVHRRPERLYRNGCTCLPVLEKRAEELSGATDESTRKHTKHESYNSSKLPTTRYKRSVDKESKLPAEPNFDTDDEFTQDRRLEKNRTRIIKSSNRQGRQLDKITQTSPHQATNKFGLQEIRKPMERFASDSSDENGDGFRREPTVPSKKNGEERNERLGDGNRKIPYRDPGDLIGEQLQRERMYEQSVPQTRNSVGEPIPFRNGTRHHNGEDRTGIPADNEWTGQQHPSARDPRFSDGIADSDRFGDEQCDCGRCEYYDSKCKPAAHPCPRYKPQMNRAFKLRNAKINNGPKKVVSSRRPVFNTKNVKSCNRMAPDLRNRARRQQNGHAMNCRFVSCINDREIDSYVNKNIAKFYQLFKP